MHRFFVGLAQEVLSTLRVSDVAINGQDEVIGGERLSCGEKTKVPENHASLVLGEGTGFLPQFNVLLHGYLLRYPVVGNTFFIVRPRPLVFHRQNFVRIRR